MGYTVIHSLRGCDNFTMMRTILIPTNDEHKYYVLLAEKYLKQLKQQNYFDVYKNVKFLTIRNKQDVEDRVSELKPDFMIISYHPNIDRSMRPKFQQGRNIPVYYVHHGLFNQDMRYNNGKFNKWHTLRATKLACDIFQYNFYLKYEDNCYKINGLPQFDLVLSLKDRFAEFKQKFMEKKKLKPGTKIILVICSHKGTGDKSFYWKLYQALNKKLSNAYFIFKTKHGARISFSKTSNCLFLNMGNVIHNFLFADAIIVHTFGTSYVESLLANPGSILYHPNYKHDAPNCYGKIDKLANNINQIIKADYHTSEHLAKVSKYISGLIGVPTIELVSDYLLNEILNIKKDLDAKKEKTT